MAGLGGLNGAIGGEGSAILSSALSLTEVVLTPRLASSDKQSYEKPDLELARYIGRSLPDIYTVDPHSLSQFCLQL